jgi:hypothetical protein
MEAITRDTCETICCICQRRKGKSGWKKGMVKTSAPPSHGLCPECYRKVMIKYGLTSVPDLRQGEALG